MATALRESVNLLKVLIGGQWGHKNLKFVWISPKISQEKIVGVLLFSEGTNAGLLMMEGFWTFDIWRCYCLCEKYSFIDAQEPGSFHFWEIFKSFSRAVFS